MIRTLLLAALMLVLPLSTLVYGQDGEDEKEKNRIEKLKEKLKERLKPENLKEELVDRVVKEVEKRGRYDHNFGLASGGNNNHTDIASGHSGDYGDVLVKSGDTYKHLDGRPASASEIAAFKKRYSTYTERFVPDGLQKYVKIKDMTFVKWDGSYTSDPKFKTRLIDSEYGHLDMQNFKLHASYDMRLGKFTFKDNFGLPHEGLGFKANSVVSLTVIDLKGETKSVKFEKGDFSLQSKLTFALNAGPYARIDYGAIGTEYGGYSRTSFDAGVRGSATLAMPTKVKYKKLNLTVTPYVSGSAWSGNSGSMDYEMDWHGNERHAYDLNSDRGFNWSAGVRVSVSLDDLGKTTRGIIDRLRNR